MLRKNQFYPRMQCFIVFFIIVNLAIAQNENSAGFVSGNIVSSESATIRTPVRISDRPYDDNIMGVYSDDIKLDEESKALFKPNFFLNIGITKVMYNSENGLIKRGDFITSSSQHGVGMKATKSGMVVGVALEDAIAPSGLIKCRVLIQYVKQ